MKTRKADIRFSNKKATEVKSDSKKMPSHFWNSNFNHITGWYLPNLTTYND
jgi:hypothetical protein